MDLTSGLGVHAVICTANVEKAYEQSMQMLRRLGTLVCVGIPNTPFRLPTTPFEMIVKGDGEIMSLLLEALGPLLICQVRSYDCR